MDVAYCTDNTFIHKHPNHLTVPSLHGPNPFRSPVFWVHLKRTREQYLGSLKEPLNKTHRRRIFHYPPPDSFCCYFSAALSPCFFAFMGYVPLLTLVFLPLQSTVVVLVILTATTYLTTSHRRFALRALSFASFSPTLSLHHILVDPLSALQHSRHTKRGE